jgi:hypothetical protein
VWPGEDRLDFPKFIAFSLRELACEEPDELGSWWEVCEVMRYSFLEPEEGLEPTTSSHHNPHEKNAKPTGTLA